MEIVPFIVAYGAIGIFLIAVIVRIRLWSKMPMHVRWELYPVAHEAKRAHYGGSYLEDGEWWKKKREVSLWGELKVMIPEIFFLVALKENNPKLWLRSFPFHFGLYLVMGATGLMMVGAGLVVLLPDLFVGSLGILFQYAVVAMGAGGLGLALVGAVGLLERRLNSPDLRDFTSPSDIFNLVFFLVAFGTAFANFVLVDQNFALTMGFVNGLVTFNMTGFSGTGIHLILPTATVVLMSLLVLYIPLTHMSHFIGKYFAYHAIRWDDEPNLAGGPKEKEIGAVLSQKVTWAADHIDGKGEKSWADLATEEFKK